MAAGMHASPQSTDDLALRLGEALLRSGSSSASTTSSLLALYRSSELHDVSVAVTMGQITISRPGQDGAAPTTLVHETTTGALDILLRSRTNQILEDVVLGHLGIEQALEAMAQLEAQRTLVSHWPAVLGFSAIGVGFSLILGGSALTTTAAGLLAVVDYATFAVLERVRVPGILSLGAGGLMAVVGATGLSAVTDGVQTAELMRLTLVTLTAKAPASWASTPAQTAVRTQAATAAPMAAPARTTSALRSTQAMTPSAAPTTR